MGESYQEPPEVPSIPVPPKWVWMRFLEYKRWSEKKVGKKPLIEVHEAFEVYLLEREFGQLQFGAAAM